MNAMHPSFAVLVNGVEARLVGGGRASQGRDLGPVLGLKLDLPVRTKLGDIATLQVTCSAFGGRRRRTLFFAQFRRPRLGLGEAFPPASARARAHFDRQRNGALWFEEEGHRCGPSPVAAGRLQAHPLSSWAETPSESATVALSSAHALVPGVVGGGDALARQDGACSVIAASWRGRDAEIAALFVHVHREEYLRLMLHPKGVLEPRPCWGFLDGATVLATSLLTVPRHARSVVRTFGRVLWRHYCQGVAVRRRSSTAAVELTVAAEPDHLGDPDRVFEWPRLQIRSVAVTGVVHDACIVDCTVYTSDGDVMGAFAACDDRRLRQGRGRDDGAFHGGAVREIPPGGTPPLDGVPGGRVDVGGSRSIRAESDVATTSITICPFASDEERARDENLEDAVETESAWLRGESDYQRRARLRRQGRVTRRVAVRDARVLVAAASWDAFFDPGC